MSEFAQSHDVFWRKLAAADPGIIAQSTGAVYDESRKSFTVAILGTPYTVLVADRRIVDAASPDKNVPFDVKIILITYLASGKSASVTGDWVGEQSLPSGAIFFRNTHALPKQPLIDAFGNEVERLSVACTMIAGHPVDEKGDLAVEFAALPRVPIRLIYWKDDGEFPPGVTFLFDRSAATLLPLDGVLALVNYLVRRLIACAPGQRTAG